MGMEIASELGIQDLEKGGKKLMAFFFVSLLCLGLRLIYIEERRERINVE
jgi:hypothetical protein